MNENVSKWVAALRSGDYAQTTHALRDDKGYCCLGVACDLYAKEHPGAHWAEPEYADTVYSFEGAGPDAVLNRVMSVLPPDVRGWLELKDSAGVYQGPGDERDHSLTEDNDTGGTFAEIANTLERAPAGLFVTQKEEA